jgi:Lon protease-like protein
MDDFLLPLFPLEVVLFPGTPVPLHIFEDRYKEMIGAAVQGKTEFGIVLAGQKGILNIGCSAVVEEVVNTYEDGRMDIVAAGRRRFEVLLLDQQKSYLRASVSFFDDDTPEAPPLELRAAALAGLDALRQASDNADIVAPDHRDPQLSFKIAYFITELSFRQVILSLRSETERLKRLADYLPEYVAKVRRIAHVKKVAPRNGSAYLRTGSEDAAG